MNKRADELNKNDSYMLDNTVWTVLGVKPINTRNETVTFQSTRTTGAVWQHSFPYDEEIQILNNEGELE